jgi:hypothetical protein
MMQVYELISGVALKFRVWYYLVYHDRQALKKHEASAEDDNRLVAAKADDANNNKNT